MKEKTSYQIGTLQDSEVELKRLAIQANLMKEMEKKFLVESGLRPDYTVLEIGCGPGFITNLLCEIVPDGKLIVTDRDQSLIDLCKKNIAKEPKNGVQYINTTFDDLTSIKDQVDFAYIRFVLQHVTDQEKLLKNVYSTLKPGGILCVLDSDDDLVLQYPEDLFHTNLLKEAQQVQKEKGGDRFVGKKIPSFFYRLGVKEVRPRILTFTTSDISFESLSRILFGFKSQITGNVETLSEWMKATSDKVKKGEYFLSAGVFLVIGKK